MMNAQYHIPRRSFYLAAQYPTITWKRANEIYEQIVVDLLKEHNVECILDIGAFGQGMSMAEREFEKRLREELRKEEIKCPT